MSFRKRSERSVHLPPLGKERTLLQVEGHGLSQRPSFRARLTHSLFRKERKAARFEIPEFIVSSDDPDEEDWDMQTNRERLGARHGLGISVKKVTPAPWEEKENLEVDETAKRGWGRRPSLLKKKTEEKVLVDVNMKPLAYMDIPKQEEQVVVVSVNRPLPTPPQPQEDPAPPPPLPTSQFIRLVPLAEARERMKSSSSADETRDARPWHNERAAHSTGELPDKTSPCADWVQDSVLKSHSGAPLLDLKRMTMNLDSLRLDLGLDHLTLQEQRTSPRLHLLPSAGSRMQIDRAAPGPLRPIQEFNRLSMAFQPTKPSSAIRIASSHQAWSEDEEEKATVIPDIIIEDDEAGL